MQLTMALQLSECVYSWHAAGCVHYEICPATVVRSSADTVRLGKLGSIDRYPACKAPEQLENVFIQSSAYTSAVDIWALGVTLLHAWTGRQPCAGQHEAQIMQRMRAGDVGVLRDLEHSDMSPELRVRDTHELHALCWDVMAAILRGTQHCSHHSQATVRAGCCMGT